MNLQQLHYLVATVEHGTMTAAARTLHVSQPALTRAVRALERELDVQLLARDGRLVRPTPAGTAVAEHARILAGLERIRTVAERQGLTLVATPTLGADLGPRLVNLLARRCPEADVSLEHLCDPVEVLTAVRDGCASAGLTDVADTDGLAAVPLAEHDIVLLCPRDTHVTEPLPHRGLGDLPLILPAAGGFRRRQAERMFAKLGIQPRIACQTDERSAWNSLVAGGVGCAIVDRAQAERAPRDRTRIVTFDPPIRRAVSLVYRADNPGRPLRELLTALVPAVAIGSARSPACPPPAARR